ncbi:copper homeostasis periplasmic binding protein CopC [Rickettsiales bacterium LUAb2]
MKKISVSIFICLLVFGFLFAPIKVFAHAHLLNQYPAKNSKSASINSITLNFSEAIEPALSKISVIGANNTIFSIQKILISKNDEKEVIIPLKTKLSKGSYKVNWQVISKDGHKTSGRYQFTIE